jgi:hypothetical protein
MKPAPRAALPYIVAVLAWLALAAPLLVAQDAPVLQGAPVVTQPALTPEQMEAFLLNAKILRMRDVNKGITGTKRATLSDGQLTHDAHIHTVDIAKFVFAPATGNPELNFKDTYRYNIAGYRLARLLGLENVPMSVERRVGRDPAAITWWIDDVMMDELERLKRVKLKTLPKEWPPARTAGYIHVMRVFDELIANNDRNTGNQLWATDGKLWLIDHTRAFRLQKTLKAPRLLERCERQLFAAMRTLTAETLTAAVGTSLEKTEIGALLARRDLIVKLFEEKIAARGEAVTLYNLQR